ncbi:TRAP transporter substrate-binding protein [Flavilitoribacter nigricans]|uniref:ABC transporter substrate-binding protein n=1 Tax=Flavilitoribacter nigricans (strain ATCC 23147 / DSM 23189 / NBRC 102662 / NCIMB 1420 / SS-2) TaxID=1122177 RepID=A0A2D0N245_FLAN2|nr:TRAP transporter substrate-binding protein [Flavilitoribacter nigricans]PHN02601.1 ABC transporter substrate-binding protein [Flavilitoribacter nigricans DSM 23189 = NBRC 102662]
MKINRKSFFKSLAIGTIGLPVFLRTFLGKNFAQSRQQVGAIDGQRHNWKMVTTWPPNFPIIGEACQLFADSVEAMSGGRLHIQVYGGGELVPPLEAFDAVRTGGAEMASGSAYYWAGKLPSAPFFSTVPFGMNAQQANAWMISGGGLQLWEELYAPYNLLPMPGGNTGVQMGGWFNREINSLADLKGLKMRIPGLGGKVFERIGGSPVLMAGSELYTNLERGVIDATEWLCPFHDNLMGFQEIAKYYYYPGWHEPGTVLELLFNKEKFEALPADLQAILRTAAAQMNIWVLSTMEARNATTLAAMIETGVDIRPFPEDVISELRNQTKQVIKEMTDQDPFTKRVYESYKTFQQQSNNWANLSERMYYDSLT